VELARIAALSVFVCGVVVGWGFGSDSGFAVVGRYIHQDCGLDGGHRVHCDP
jgi:hypothetical protein